MSESLPPLKSPTAGASSAGTYTDLNSLAAIKKDPNSPQAIHALAQQVDALFLQMMLKSMREAGAEEGAPDSNAMGMYQDLYDKQISLTLSQHGGIGIGALLTRQIAASAAASAAAAAAASAAGASAKQLQNPQPPLSGARHGASAQAAATMAQSEGEFVSAVLPAIRVAAAALGVNPLGMLAQAALETGWGKRMARTADGAPSLNLFGVKADAAWNGARASANTVEVSGGVVTQRQAAFRAYGSIAASVSDFANLLGSSPRYAHAIAAGGDAQGYVDSIGESGYATDPTYATKLNDILHGSTLREALKAAGTPL